MNLIETVIKTIEPALTDMGYELVRVTVQGKELQTLQIMAERKDRRDIFPWNESRFAPFAIARSEAVVCCIMSIFS